MAFKMKGFSGFKRTTGDEAEKLKEDIKRREEASDAIFGDIPTVKSGTPQGDRYVKETVGTKYEFGGEFYEDKKSWQEAIAASKNMSLSEYRKSKATRKAGESPKANYMKGYAKPGSKKRKK